MEFNIVFMLFIVLGIVGGVIGQNVYSSFLLSMSIVIRNNVRIFGFFFRLVFMVKILVF